MKIPKVINAVVALVIAGGLSMQLQGADIGRGWSIQSSVKIQEKGEAISRAGYRPEGWYPADMPSTVLGVLVRNGVYPDPYFGMNLRSIPGTGYPVGVNFSNLEMPEDSPFRVPWWFRKEFQLERKSHEFCWLHFDGINFRANIWLNGRLIADSRQVAGAYRTYEFDISEFLAPDRRNVLAVEVFPPTPKDLALNWVDWNPTPPDKNMGLWRDVTISTSGPVTLRHPQVVSQVELPGLKRAQLMVSAELHNAGDRPVTAEVICRIEKARFSQKIQMSPSERRTVSFAADRYPRLNMADPRIWWPVHTGPQNLYPLTLEVKAGGRISDSESLRFGIRQIDSELNAQGYRVFKVNGRNILIRGGGWAPDMLLNPSEKREIAEIRYVKDMNLNAIRFEGKAESRRFLEMCDREGILVIAGWCCCDHWEKWQNWDEEDLEVAALSLRDQLKRIRNHPSILTWWNGSDNPPPANVEQRYVDVLKACNWPNPYQSSATAKSSKLTGPTGLKMTGPYEWVPPHYWYVDTRNGGAYGFNTETSPGPAVPPIESLRRMLPADHLWPIDAFWNFHAGGGNFKTLQVFTEAINRRMGEASGAEDYARKAQLMAYEGQRAMFEAYARNKYLSTGVIQWMMNNAWPSMIWHLYDYYLRPGGGYFGTKTACEPLHIQYSYDDRSVVVVNSTYQQAQGLKASARLYNLDLAEKFSKESTVDAAADSSQGIFAIPTVEGLSGTHFLRLQLRDARGMPLSSHVYWLSTRPETLDEAKANWYRTPVKSFADFSGLASLPKVRLNGAARLERQAGEWSVRVYLENPSTALAFFVRLKLIGTGGEELLPILWQDNFVSIWPGEKLALSARFEQAPPGSETPAVEIEGWNVERTVWPVSR